MGQTLVSLGVCPDHRAVPPWQKPAGNITVVLIGRSNYGVNDARLLIEQGRIHGAGLVGVIDPYEKIIADISG